MALTDEMAHQGSWLFRWRSFVPVGLLALMLPPSLFGLHTPLGSYEFHKAWELICLLISLLGLAIRCATVGFVPRGTSGRGTLKQSARTLNTTGIYSLVRHPLYVGNYVIGLGVTLVWFDWWAPVIYSLCFWLYYERIMIAEEKYLKNLFGDAFLKWSQVTPSFIPSWTAWKQWKRPSLSFSVLSMLRREYSTLLLLVLLHASMEVVENYWLENRLAIGLEWGTILIVTAAIYILLATLKKRTSFLRVVGR
jgi:protein-S-isoprenylcysteine O-methyltransferase Ste14